MPDGQLWGAPFGYGLHPCIKPTAKYKGEHNIFGMHNSIVDLLGLPYIRNFMFTEKLYYVDTCGIGKYKHATYLSPFLF